MTAPAKAAPMREDADVTFAREVSEEIKAFSPSLSHTTDARHHLDRAQLAIWGLLRAHTARPDAGDEDVERVARQQADHWLEDMQTNSLDAKHVSLIAMAGNCIRLGMKLAAMPVGVDRGMVEVPRVLPVAICDKMTEVKIADGRGGFTALNWEEAEQVWEVALASLSALMSKGQPR